jgi:glycine cleavage system regulatory protein
MQIDLIMTVIGPDRPGLVDRLASLIASHQGNWLESRMSRLGGQFAGILRVQVPSQSESALRNALETLAADGLQVVLRGEQNQESSTSRGALVELELVGQDQPGIVRQISKVLASHGVNVEELATGCVSAPMSGETLFTAKAKLLLPKGCDPKRLRADLEAIASDLMVDVLFGKPA